MRLPDFLRTGAAAMGVLIAVTVSGCISLLPKQTPARLYRFGADESATLPASSVGPRFTVRMAPLGFEPAASGARILTVNGGQAAYIAGARWIAPAGSLFEAALTRAFDVDAGSAHLLAPGEPAIAEFVLKIDVRTFEVRYSHGAGAAPKVVVEIYAALSDRADPRIEASRLFRASAPARSNSMHAIVAAFDDAVRQVLTQLVPWVDKKGG
jgi:cholesterol transport system auxiliary component